jgi:predicted nucleic acid-binding protein
MMRVFLDTSVIFSAAFSATGASREIIRQAIRGRMRLITSPLVLEEARRNLQTKAPEVLFELQTLYEAVGFEIVRPTKREIKGAMQHTVLKDAPIIAAAKRAKVDFLVSLDRRHLVGQPAIAQRSGLTIILPEELLVKLAKSTVDAK